MDVQLKRTASFRGERGQAIILVVLLLFFVFLPLAALAIDGATLYLMRRDLQNVADMAALSACREFAEGGTAADALNEALVTIEDPGNLGNVGPWSEFVGDNPPLTNIGVGIGLRKGIEVASPETRVALQRRAPTILTQFVGVSQPTVMAQARCDARAGGGLLPIAIQRYEGQAGGSEIDHLTSGGGTIYPNPCCVTTTIPNGRYGPFDVPLPTSPASGGAPGPEVVILGQSAVTNNGESSMRDLVLLDIRNVASVNDLEYYNGADSQADAAKDMSQGWIYERGYPGPFPKPGSQVAILDGASNNMAAGAMLDTGYRPGDVVAAIVYDGFVWTSPDFSVELVPESGWIALNSTAPVAYTVQIAKAGPAATGWYSPLDFDLEFNFNDSLPPGSIVTLDGNVLATENPSYSVSDVTETGWSGRLVVWNTQVITTPYLSGINVIATSNVGLAHGASSNYGFHGTAPIDNDFTVRSDNGSLVAHQEDSISVDLAAFGVGAGCKNVPVVTELVIPGSGTVQPWSTLSPSDPETTIDVHEGKSTSSNFGFSISPGAILGSFILRFKIGPKASCGFPQHTMEMPIETKLPVPGATPNKFVIVQGYANFEITRVDANDVWGYAISDLYPWYTDIVIGLRPRLVPWE